MEAMIFAALAAWLVLPIVNLVLALNNRKTLKALQAQGLVGAIPPPGAPAATPAPAVTPAPVAPVATPAPVAGSALGTSPASVAPSARPAPRASSPRPSLEGRNLEQIIGGTGFNIAGAIALTIALAFLLKHAFDAEWFGLLGRFMLGLGVGLGLCGFGTWLVRTDRRVFGQGVVGTGLAALYATFHVAHNVYGLMPALGATAAMLGVTALGMGLALWHRSQLIAMLALIGGFLVPLLVSPGNEPVRLALYLGALSLLGLVLSGRKGWRWLDAIALLGCHLGWIAWADDVGRSPGFAAALAAHIGTLLLFIITPAARRWLARQSLRVGDLALWAGAGAAFLMWTAWLFERNGREGLGWIAVDLALLYLLLAVIARRREGESAAAQQAPLALALVYALVAVPLELDRIAVTCAWMAEGTVVLWLGCRSKQRWMQAMALGSLALACGHILAIDLDVYRSEGMMLLNLPSILLLLCAGALAVSAMISRKHALRVGSLDIARVLGVVAGAMGMIIISVDIWSHAWLPMDPPPPHQPDGHVAMHRARWAQTGLSIAWAVYAGIAVLAGFVRRSATARWFGLALFGMLAFKAIVVDLSDLPALLRFASFLAAGVALMAVSWLYSRRRTT